MSKRFQIKKLKKKKITTIKEIIQETLFGIKQIETLNPNNQTIGPPLILVIENF